MREITAASASDYLRDSGWVSERAQIHVRELSGGVSNIVLRVDVADRPPLVLKQCRERLRVALEWCARLDRIWMEYATLELLRAILPEDSIPHIMFEDRPNYLFAMTCAPDDAVTWKAQLMSGHVDPEIAGRLGTILATIHTKAARHPALSGILSDSSHFDELRVDPYYRTTARAHPDLESNIDSLITSMSLPDGERTLTLGDFSPKNILVHKDGLMLLDFECAHAGDPAFDLGFFLSHLLLKTIRAANRDDNLESRYAALAPRFLNAYLDRREIDESARVGLIRRAILHTAACSLARVDGKSPVEYLDADGQADARAFAREALRVEPVTWDAFIHVFESEVQRERSCRR
jgi:5-methylthioribose kinase